MKKKKIKTQLRTYLDIQLRLCKVYMQEQDLTMAKNCWQQAIGATTFTSVSMFNIYHDADFSTEIDVMWETDFKEAFEKTLFPEVGA